MTFAHVVAPKRAVFSDWNRPNQRKQGAAAPKEPFYEATGPLRKEHAFTNFLALRAPELNSS